MEQKLPIHKNRGGFADLAALWNLTPLPARFWNPMRFGPMQFGWWNEDAFGAMNRNMNLMFDNMLETLSSAASGMPPQADVAEDRRRLRINLDVPGLKAEDIDVSAEDNVLTVSADKQEKRNGTHSSYSFSYAVTLPENADIDAAEVSFENNRLSINIPKRGGGKKLAVGKAESGPEKKPDARKEKTTT